MDHFERLKNAAIAALKSFKKGVYKDLTLHTTSEYVEEGILLVCECGEEFRVNPKNRKDLQKGVADVIPYRISTGRFASDTKDGTVVVLRLACPKCQKLNCAAYT